MKTLLLLLAMACTVTTFANPTADHVKAAQEHGFDVPLPPDQVFIFFEPVGEKRWTADWQPVFASPADASLHDGSVFTVERPPAHGGPPIRSVWTITRYEPPHVIEYHNVLVGLRATRIKVSLTEPDPGRTRVAVRYVYTGLSAEGDAAIRGITPLTFRQMIDSWGTEIAAYLERGTPASP